MSLAPFTGSLQQSVSESRFSGIFETVGKIASPFIPDSVKNWQQNVPDLPNLPEGVELDLDNIPLNNIGDLINGNPDINLDGN